ncbi:MAG: hypothetical protein ACI8RZ_006874 [Myxococcota bacterium]|jgi:hypothetical protein
MTPEELDRLLAEVSGAASDDLELPELDADPSELGEEIHAQAMLARAPLGPGFSERIRAELAVIPLPKPKPSPKQRRWMPSWLTALPMAAGLLFGVRIASLPPIPPALAYAVTMQAENIDRSSPSSNAPLKLSDGSVLQIVLKTATPPEHPTQALAWIHHGGQWQQQDWEPESIDGSFRFTGEVTGVSDGEHTLLIGAGPTGPRGLLGRALYPGGAASFTASELDAIAQGTAVAGWTFEARDITLYGEDE